MEFKKITRLAVFLCLLSAVLSINVQHGKHTRLKKSREMVMHPKQIHKRASTPPKESPRKGAPGDDDDDADIGEISQMLDDEFMRRMELDDSEMHDPSKKSTEMEEAMMHPKKIYRRASTPPKESSRKGAPAADDDAGIGKSSQILDDEFMRRMELDDSEMHDPPKKPTGMEEAMMHPKKIYRRASTPPKESSRKGAPAADDDAGIGEISQILDDEFMRRMELDDSEMHDPPKYKKSRPLRAMDLSLDGMHPRPVEAGVQAEGEKSVDDPAIRDSDLFSVLGQDILQQFAFDDSAMHPREVAKQPSRPSSKSKAPEMDQRVMHPHVANKEQQKDIPAIEPSKEEDSDISTELHEDFMRQFELDDSIMHPADARIEWKKSSYYNGNDKTAGLRMHPKAAPQQQQGSEDVVKDDDDVDDEIDADDELGHDFMQRMELDDSGMHDPNWQPREDAEKFQRNRRGNSRRLMSLDNDEAGSRPQMAMKTVVKLRQIGFTLHASCRLNWVFGVNCSSVSKTLEQQIAKWSTKDNCDNGGEKCLYKLVSSNRTTLLATHETPEKHYVDDLSFQLTQMGSETCAVFGFSTSETWYAVLDKGTNYCNLHNLITGSGLNNSAGYKETTKDSICTQFSSADCDVY